MRQLSSFAVRVIVLATFGSGKFLFLFCFSKLHLNHGARKHINKEKRKELDVLVRNNSQTPCPSFGYRLRLAFYQPHVLCTSLYNENIEYLGYAEILQNKSRSKSNRRLQNGRRPAARSGPRPRSPSAARPRRTSTGGPAASAKPKSSLSSLRRRMNYNQLFHFFLFPFFFSFFEDRTAPRQRRLSRKVVSGKGLKQKSEFFA